MINIVAVEYINTLPYIKAIQSSDFLKDKVKLERTDPKHCADALLKDKADLVLLPIGALSSFEQLFCQLNFGIACNGEVGTVGIFSNKYWNDICLVKESSASRSSNLLLHTLNKFYWNDQLKIVDANSTINSDAALIIGDDAFQAKNVVLNYYDLGLHWKNFSDRPFLFALWLSKKPLPEDIINELNRAFSFYTNHEQLNKLEENFKDFSIENYLTQQIHYKINTKHKDSLEYFLKINNITNPIHYME